MSTQEKSRAHQRLAAVPPPEAPALPAKAAAPGLGEPGGKKGAGWGGRWLDGAGRLLCRWSRAPPSRTTTAGPETSLGAASRGGGDATFAATGRVAASWAARRAWPCERAGATGGRGARVCSTAARAAACARPMAWPGAAAGAAGGGAPGPGPGAVDGAEAGWVTVALGAVVGLAADVGGLRAAGAGSGSGAGLLGAGVLAAPEAAGSLAAVGAAGPSLEAVCFLVSAAFAPAAAPAFLGSVAVPLGSLGAGGGAAVGAGGGGGGTAAGAGGGAGAVAVGGCGGATGSVGAVAVTDPVTAVVVAATSEATVSDSCSAAPAASPRVVEASVAPAAGASRPSAQPSIASDTAGTPRTAQQRAARAGGRSPTGKRVPLIAVVLGGVSERR
jgi:hypothetical protein